MERKAKGGIIAILGIILIVIVLVYPSLYAPNSNTHNKGDAKIIISINFGEKVLKIKWIKPGKSVIKSLQEIANITTAYNGKFITSIDGLRQNSTFFWFYYVNGIYANIGAEDYRVHPGDVIRWDFHRWIQNEIIYGEIEDFPEPLLHGYNGRVYNTTIIYQEEYKKYAEELESYLSRNGINVSISTTIGNNKNNNLIVLGYPSKIGDFLNQNYKKLGWRYYVKNDKIVDISGNEYYGAFAQLSQSPYNPKGLDACENVVIWIYSTDAGYMSKAIEALINGSIYSFWYFSGEKV